MFIENVSDEAQIEIIEDLANEIWNEYFTPIIGKAQVDYMLNTFQSKRVISEQIKQGFFYFLIKNKSEPIGYMGVLPKDNELLLSKFYITLAERNKGHGSIALAFLEKLASKKNVHKITLTVNKNNSDTIKAYKKFGFTTTKAVVKDIGHHFVMDDYVMEKEI